MQSAPTYTSRLQQVLAAKVKRETRSHELEECVRDRDREKARAGEMEKKVDGRPSDQCRPKKLRFDRRRKNKWRNMSIEPKNAISERI
jgi:hypothetical protein